jgi:anti-sigma regulatory factor (Ser/Thr protein kinase)
MTYWSRSFDGIPECVPEVREHTRQVLGDRRGADVVELVASELAGNAIRHSDSGEPGGQFTVHLATFADRWQVRVDDEGGPRVPHICEPPPISIISATRSRAAGGWHWSRRCHRRGGSWGIKPLVRCGQKSRFREK